MGSYAGVDWASEKHDLLVADETGEAILAATYAHDERGLTALCKALVRLKVQLVAIGLDLAVGAESRLAVSIMGGSRSGPDGVCGGVAGDDRRVDGDAGGSDAFTWGLASGLRAG